MSADPHPPTGSPVPADPTQPLAPDRSIGDLFSDLGSDLSNLVSTELEIAKLEIKQEVTKAAKGAGFLGSGAVAGLYAIGFLSMALAWGIAEALSPWSGFLIVGLIWAAIATGLALTGKGRLDQASMPAKTIAELDADRRLAQTRTATGVPPRP